MYDSNNDKHYISLDELINALTEAKEHGIDGKSKVLLQHPKTKATSCLNNVLFDSNNVILKL